MGKETERTADWAERETAHRPRQAAGVGGAGLWRVGGAAAGARPISLPALPGDVIGRQQRGRGLRGAHELAWAPAFRAARACLHPFLSRCRRTYCGVASLRHHGAHGQGHHACLRAAWPAGQGACRTRGRIGAQWPLQRPGRRWHGAAAGHAARLARPWAHDGASCGGGCSPARPGVQRPAGHSAGVQPRPLPPPGPALLPASGLARWLQRSLQLGSSWSGTRLMQPAGIAPPPLVGWQSSSLQRFGAAAALPPRR